jgi:hypothetical protein
MGSDRTPCPGTGESALAANRIHVQEGVGRGARARTELVGIVPSGGELLTRAPEQMLTRSIG